MTLQLGRMTLFGPEVIDHGQNIQLSGDFIGSSLTETLAMRDDIRQLEGRLVAIAWTDEPSIDGFYHVMSSQAATSTLNDDGFILWSVSLLPIGSSHDVDLQSRRVGTVLDNDFGVTQGASEPFHAPPLGHIAYETGGSIPSSVTRTGSDGAMTVWRDVGFGLDPVWACDPSDFYEAAAEVEIESIVRTGIMVPDHISNTDWRINNSLVRVSGNGTSGRINVSHHDGSIWETAKIWQVRAGGSEVGEWDRVSIIRNDPEEVIVRLIRTVSSGGRYTLDFTLRRGSRFVQAYLTGSASTTFRIALNSAETGTNVGNQSIRASSNDGNGNRYVIGSAHSLTRNTAPYIELASTTTLDFYIGSEIGGSGAQSGDQAAQLELQYYGNAVETTEALKR